MMGKNIMKRDDIESFYTVILKDRVSVHLKNT